MPEGLSEEKRGLLIHPALEKEFGPRDSIIISQKEAAEQVLKRAPGLEIHEINMWEGDKAPEVCNVGIARHAGTVEAISNLKSDECPVMGTDADAIFSTGKVKNVIDLFREDPKLMVARGELVVLDSDSEEDRKLNRATTLVELSCAFTQLQSNLLTVLKGGSPVIDIDKLRSRVKAATGEEGGEWSTDGINTNFRASLYKQVQFRPIPGEEDTLFGKDLAAAGHTICDFGTKLTTATPQRFSERASTGLGRELLEKYGSYTEHPEMLPVPSMAAARFKDAITNVLIGIDGFGQGKIFGNIPAVIGVFARMGKDRELQRFKLEEKDYYELTNIFMGATGVVQFSEMLIAFADRRFAVPVEQAYEEIIRFLETKERKCSRKHQGKIAELKGVMKNAQRNFRRFQCETAGK